MTGIYPKYNNLYKILKSRGKKEKKSRSHGAVLFEPETHILKFLCSLDSYVSCYWLLLSSHLVIADLKVLSEGLVLILAGIVFHRLAP